MRREFRHTVGAAIVAASVIGGSAPAVAAPPPAPIAFAPIGTYSTGLASIVGEITAAEIVAVEGDRMYVSNAFDISIDIVDISTPSAPTLVLRVPLAVFGGGVNSVDVAKDVIAVAVEATVKTDPGTIVFINAKNDSGAVLGTATVGALPDMVTFTKDGRFVVVANEGEPNPAYTIDPVGSVSVVDVQQHTKKHPNPKPKDNVTIGFAEFNVGGPRNAELPADVRIYGPGASVAQDLEPEYVTIADDGKTAWVSLQENNAVAILDLHKGRVDAIVGLGRKDHSLAANKLDASDRDGPGTAGAINIANRPVFGLYEPDALATVKIKGTTYVLSANEGDLRDYNPPGPTVGYIEESRVGAAGYQLDAAVFPDGTLKTSDDKLNRLTASVASGNLDADPQFERIEIPGARSFSIWSETGQLLWDSGDQLEQIVAAANPLFFFNSDNAVDNFDNRSDNKGPEPEAITVGQIQGRTYAFVGLEREGGVVVFDITDPTAPVFLQYANNRAFGMGTVGPDSGPEHIEFVKGSDSPTHEALLVVSNETTGTVTIYEAGTAP